MAYTKQAGFFITLQMKQVKNREENTSNWAKFCVLKKKQPKTKIPRIMGEIQSALNPIKTALNKISTGF